MAKKVAKKVTKKRVKKNVERGQAHIQSSFNNTIVTITDAEGNALEPVFDGNTNIYYKVVIPTSTSSGIGKVNADATKANIKTPSTNYYVKMDQLVLEQALEASGLDKTTVGYEDAIKALDNFGYLKYAGENLWDGWDNLNNKY